MGKHLKYIDIDKYTNSKSSIGINVDTEFKVRLIKEAKESYPELTLTQLILKKIDIADSLPFFLNILIEMKKNIKEFIKNENKFTQDKLRNIMIDYLFQIDKFIEKCE